MKTGNENNEKKFCSGAAEKKATTKKRGTSKKTTCEKNPWPSEGPLFGTAKFLYGVVAPGKRASQLDMIEKLCETVDANLMARDTVRGRALLESSGTFPFSVRFGQAPVGTGKSLAALVVACAAWVRYGFRSIVATHTHVLQDQMSTKDFPEMKRELLSAFGEIFEPWKCGVLKSKESLPCRLRAEALRAKAESSPGRTLLVAGEGRVHVATAESLQELLVSMGEKRFELSEDHMLFPLVAARECSSSCPEARRCPAIISGRAAWPLSVTNHAYLLAAGRSNAFETDGLVNAETKKIPSYRLSELCFFDEAHHLVGYRAGGRPRVSFDSRELEYFERFVLPGHLAVEFDDEACFRREASDILRAYAETGNYKDVNFNTLSEKAKKRISSSSKKKKGADILAREGAESVLSHIEKIRSIENARKEAKKTGGRFQTEGGVVSVVDDEMSNLGEDLSMILPEARAVFCFSGTLFSKKETESGEGGKAFEAETGLSATLPSFSVDSPFSYEATRIWIPKDSPLSSEPKRGRDERERKWLRFTENFCRSYIPPYLKENLGGVLVLCSSRSRMKYLADAVTDELAKRGASSWLVMTQGERSRKKLARDFTRARVSTVLFGSASFREGFDVRGAGLTWVIIDRLPFPVPGSEDSMRVERLKKWGFVEDSFLHSLGLMKLHLEQSAGRLVRSDDDWGTVTVLDGRILSKWDEWKCGECLPPSPTPPLTETLSPEKWIDTAIDLESFAAERLERKNRM